MHPAPSGTDLVELVIPCLNEEVALPALLAGVPSGWAVIVRALRDFAGVLVANRVLLRSRTT